MKTLSRLTYFSRASTGEFVDIDAVLRTAIHNNRLDAITGILVCHSGWFIQALEGPQEAVSAAYARIYADRRHRTPTIVSRGPVEARLFPRWTMCAHELSDTDEAILALLDRRGGFDPALLSSAAIEAMLLAVAAVHDRTLNAQHDALFAAFAARPELKRA